MAPQKPFPTTTKTLLCHFDCVLAAFYMMLSMPSRDFVDLVRLLVAHCGKWWRFFLIHFNLRLNEWKLESSWLTERRIGVYVCAQKVVDGVQIFVVMQSRTKKHRTHNRCFYKWKKTFFLLVFYLSQKTVFKNRSNYKSNRNWCD